MQGPAYLDEAVVKGNAGWEDPEIGSLAVFAGMLAGHPLQALLGGARRPLQNVEEIAQSPLHIGVRIAVESR